MIMAPDFVYCRAGVAGTCPRVSLPGVTVQADLSADRGSGASGRTRLRAELVSEAQRSLTVIVRETALRNLAHIRSVDKTTKRRRYTSSTLGSSPRSAHAAWDLISRGQPCSPRHPRIVGTAPMITGDFPRMERDIVRHHGTQGRSAR